MVIKQQVIKQKLLLLISKVRSLKQKLSHDNLFDITLGGFLACGGVALYNYAGWDKLIIVVAPFLVSFYNELVNVKQGAKFGWIDLVLRCLVGIILYFIII